MRYIALLACLCFATTAQAVQSAQNANSIYAGFAGGITFPQDLERSAGGGSTDLETDTGLNLGAVIGYKWAFGLRAEGEISFHQNGIDNLAGSSLGGNVSALAFMGNAWYDFHTGTPWIPYAGGGLGIASVRMDSSAAAIDDSDIVFAAQFGGGVGYEVSPGFVVSADYRYLATTDAELEDDSGIQFDAEYYSHNIMLGVRGHF